MCLPQGHNAVTSVRLEPPALLSRVKYSTSKPLRSRACFANNNMTYCSLHDVKQHTWWTGSDTPCGCAFRSRWAGVTSCLSLGRVFPTGTGYRRVRYCRTAITSWANCTGCSLGITIFS